MIYFFSKMVDKPKDKLYIYLNNDGEEHPVLTKATPHEKYILLMNDTLQSRNEDNIADIKELEIKVEEMEEEVDRSDSRRRYLKGLLKNFHEMHKWNEEIAALQITINKKTAAYLYTYKRKAELHLRILHSILIVILGLCWEFHNFWVFTELLSLLLIIVAFQYSMLRNLAPPLCSQQKERVKKITCDKAKVLKAQDYIHEFIEAQ